MRQMQLQSGPLAGGMQHLDCGIGDFGPDPVARQHADLELPLTRHPISSSTARTRRHTYSCFERHRAPDPELARVVPNRRKYHVGRVWVPTRRMNGGGTYTALCVTPST
jgi:hypothetical protein